MTTNYREVLKARAAAATDPCEHKALDNVQHRNQQCLRAWHERRLGIMPRKQSWADKLKKRFGTPLSSRRS